MITVLSTLTSINRYNAITVVPQAQSMGMTEGLQWFMPYGWPSVMAAMETQAYGFYLSLALLVLSFVFRKGKLERGIFWVMNICSLLCFMSVLGQLLKNDGLYMIGIIAWGLGLFILAVLWWFWFRQQAKNETAQ